MFLVLTYPPQMPASIRKAILRIYFDEDSWSHGADNIHVDPKEPHRASIRGIRLAKSSRRRSSQAAASQPHQSEHSKTEQHRRRRFGDTAKLDFCGGRHMG